MSLRLSVFQFSVRPHGFQPTIWRQVQHKDCLLVELHRVILAAFGFEGEYTFRFSRWLGDYLDGDGRCQRLLLPRSGKGV